ncbi:Methane monooxygenase component A beta chain [Mycobacterium marinum MB2]|nr:Methane monooxygenase component A beta chain [Mycobacterium marinum MB2]
MSAVALTTRRLACSPPPEPTGAASKTGKNASTAANASGYKESTQRCMRSRFSAAGTGRPARSVSAVSILTSACVAARLRRRSASTVISITAVTGSPCNGASRRKNSLPITVAISGSTTRLVIVTISPQSRSERSRSTRRRAPWQAGSLSQASRPAPSV